MSLFGDDPERQSQSSSNGLFETQKQSNGSGIFGDESADPWLPAPKRKVNLSEILANSDIPDQYVDLFDTYAANGSVSLTSFKELMTNAHLTEQDKESIVSAVLPPESIGTNLTRELLNLALLLIALAQQGGQVSLDAVDDMKTKKLPLPNISDVQIAKAGTSLPPAITESGGAAQSTTTTSRILEPDGLRSKIPLPLPSNESLESTNLTRKDDLNDPWSPNGSTHQASSDTHRVSESVHYTTAGVSHSTSGADAVSITTLQDKSGLPLWKHVNYDSRRKSSVVRRYSDFAWLLEVLLKKYPFRQIPLLPPKRLPGMNLTGKNADLIFLEKRRRGLTRFVNALERHPVLKGDQLVTTFLTVPTELAVWRKQASLTVKEEFDDRYLAVDLEQSLPQGIFEWMSKTQRSLKNAIESFASLTTLQERLIKRQEAISADLLRYSLSINTFCEQEGSDCDILGKENGPGIINGMKAMSKHHTRAQQIIENECRHTENVLLEDLKRHRDNLFAMNELFVRHHKYSGDSIPALEKRIATNKSRLVVLDGKVDAKESDKAKLTSSIEQDMNSITKFESRKVFIRECVWHELQYFESQQVHISKLINDMAISRLEYSKKHTDIASALVSEVEGMP